MKEKKTWPVQATNKVWGRVLIGVGFVLATILIGWAIAEYGYQQRINHLSSVVTGVGQSYVVPTGGVFKSSITTAPHFTDSLGWNDACPCPRVTKEWAVLIDPGKQSSYIRNAFMKAGYRGDISNLQVSETTAGNVKDGVTLSMGFYDLKGQPPYSASTGKEWKSFDVSAYETAH